MSKLTTLATQSVRAEINKAAFRVGRKLMTQYLTDRAERQAIKICRSAPAFRRAVKSILDQLAAEAKRYGKREPLQFLGEPRNRPRQHTIDRFRLLESKIASAPTMDGIRLSAAGKLVGLNPNSLDTLIRRHNEHHKLVIRSDYIRLRSDVLVDIIAQRFHKNSESNPRRPTKKGR